MRTIGKAVAASVFFTATFVYSTVLRASEPTCQQFVEGCYASNGVPWSYGCDPPSGGLQWCYYYCEGPGFGEWCYYCN